MIPKTSKKDSTNQKETLEQIETKIKELEKYEVELRNLYQHLRLDAEREEKINDIDNAAGQSR